MVRIFIERATGDAPESKIGVGHRYLDRTDQPMPTILAGRPVRYYLVPGGENKVTAEKPPYRVMSMVDIAAVPENGYTVASTFSGCGGSSLGYKMAGYRVLWANEFIPAAQEVYRLNHPGTFLNTNDIRTVTAADVFHEAGTEEIDLLDGSPPCASFSTCGKRAEGWGKVKNYSDTKQRVDDLFFEYIRLLRGIRPKVFVAENVSGLVKGVAKGYFKEIYREMADSGYRVKAKVLDASWLGVPQARQRLIFIGVRDDLGLEPAHPKPLSYQYTVRDALPEIFADRVIHDTRGRYSIGDVTDRPAPTVTSSGVGQIFIERETALGPAVGREYDRTKIGESSEKYFNLIRPHPDKPCNTILQMGGTGAASVCHPTERRKFSIAELKRICAFPDDFILTGTYAQQWERLGRAVPPVMMYHIAETVRREILARTA
jgi:DNA (cytosine-5)-methyltransferase 1